MNIDSRGRAFILALLTGAAPCLCASPGFSAEPFSLTSSTFEDGTMMPRRVGGTLATNPNCVGENVSPALAWAHPPAGTKSFAITMVDPESRNGLGTVHWVGYGIPASVNSLPEGAFSRTSTLFVAGKGTRGEAIFDGPCTAPPAKHHYTFVIIATDLDTTALSAGLTRDQLIAKLDGHALLASGLVGLFSKPTN